MELWTNMTQGVIYTTKLDFRGREVSVATPAGGRLRISETDREISQELSESETKNVFVNGFMRCDSNPDLNTEHVLEDRDLEEILTLTVPEVAKRMEKMNEFNIRRLSAMVNDDMPRSLESLIHAHLKIYAPKGVGASPVNSFFDSMQTPAMKG